MKESREQESRRSLSLSRSMTAISQQQRQPISASKISLTESSSLRNTGGASSAAILCSSSETESSESESESDSDEESCLSDENLSVPDRLAKRGFDYKSLFTITTRKSESGSGLRLKPPLIESLFAHVPPTINFVTIDDKSELQIHFIYPLMPRNYCKVVKFSPRTLRLFGFKTI